MVTTEERMRVLNMIDEGKITPEDGAKLLAAMGEPQGGRMAAGPARALSAEAAGGPGRTLRVRVTDTRTGNVKVSVNVPLALAGLAARIGERFLPPDKAVAVAEVLAAVRDGATGRIVEVLDEEGGEHVEVFVE